MGDKCYLKDRIRLSRKICSARSTIISLSPLVRECIPIYDGEPELNGLVIECRVSAVLPSFKWGFASRSAEETLPRQSTTVPKTSKTSASTFWRESAMIAPLWRVGDWSRDGPEITRIYWVCLLWECSSEWLNTKCGKVMYLCISTATAVSKVSLESQCKPWWS